jgi:hypothetical protein
MIFGDAIDLSQVSIRNRWNIFLNILSLFKTIVVIRTDEPIDYNTNITKVINVTNVINMTNITNVIKLFRVEELGRIIYGE